MALKKHTHYIIYAAFSHFDKAVHGAANFIIVTLQGSATDECIEIDDRACICNDSLQQGLATTMKASCSDIWPGFIVFILEKTFWHSRLLIVVAMGRRSKVFQTNTAEWSASVAFTDWYVSKFVGPHEGFRASKTINGSGSIETTRNAT